MNTVIPHYCEPTTWQHRLHDKREIGEGKIEMKCTAQHLTLTMLSTKHPCTICVKWAHNSKAYLYNNSGKNLECTKPNQSKKCGTVQTQISLLKYNFQSNQSNLFTKQKLSAKNMPFGHIMKLYPEKI